MKVSLLVHRKWIVHNCIANNKIEACEIHFGNDNQMEWDGIKFERKIDSPQ